MHLNKNTTENSTTLSKLVQIFTSSIKDKDITESSTMSELGVDSLTSVEIVMAIEEAFSIQISETEAASFGSKKISEIATRIHELQEESKSHKSSK